MLRNLIQVSEVVQACDFGGSDLLPRLANARLQASASQLSGSRAPRVRFRSTHKALEANFNSSWRLARTAA